MKFKINVRVGDFKPSSRVMTAKGLLCHDAVLAIGDQVRDYHPLELGMPGTSTSKLVKMFTPADVLFSDEVMGNLEGCDFVNEHPVGNLVTTKNWRSHSIGSVHDVRRDGNKLIGNILVKDEKAIKAIQSNKKSALSIGYELMADKVAGTAADGKGYDIVVTSMIGDHVALVKKGRGGHEVRIGDKQLETKMRKITLANGMTFEIEGENLEAFEQGLKTQNDEYKALKDKSDGEITIGEKTFKLSDSVAIQAAFDAITEQKNAAENKATELEKNTIKPEDVEKLAAERSKTIEEAKSLKPDLEPAGKSLDDIISESVTAHAGDASVKAVLGDSAIGEALADKLKTAFDVLVATKAKQPAGKVNAQTGDSATAKALQNLNTPAITDPMQLISDAKSNMYRDGE